MSTDPTPYPHPMEPTQPVYSNPYELPSPLYGDVPPIPPPPPKQRRSRLLAASLIFLSCLVVALAGALFAVTRGHVESGLVQTPSPSTRETTPSQSAVPTKQPYSAKSLIQDFQAHGLPLDQLHYGISILQFVGSSYDTVITTQSSAEFIDPSFCTGPCEAGSVWLGVYNSPIDAQSEYNGLLTYRTTLEQNGPGPGALAYMVQAGRCLLIGEPATSAYAEILRGDRS